MPVWVLSVGFSPDGAQIVSGGDDGTVRIWDVASGEQVAQLDGHAGGVLSVGFSPDGAQIVSGGDDSTVRIWDVASGEAGGPTRRPCRGRLFGGVQPGWGADRLGR